MLRTFLGAAPLALLAYFSTDSLEFGILVSCICTYVLR